MVTPSYRFVRFPPQVGLPSSLGGLPSSNSSAGRRDWKSTVENSPFSRNVMVAPKNIGNILPGPKEINRILDAGEPGTGRSSGSLPCKAAGKRKQIKVSQIQNSFPQRKGPTREPYKQLQVGRTLETEKPRADHRVHLVPQH